MHITKVIFIVLFSLGTGTPASARQLKPPKATTPYTQSIVVHREELEIEAVRLEEPAHTNAVGALLFLLAALKIAADYYS